MLSSIVCALYYLIVFFLWSDSSLCLFPPDTLYLFNCLAFQCMSLSGCELLYLVLTRLHFGKIFLLIDLGDRVVYHLQSVCYWFLISLLVCCFHVVLDRVLVAFLCLSGKLYLLEIFLWCLRIIFYYYYYNNSKRKKVENKVYSRYSTTLSNYFSFFLSWFHDLFFYC